MKTYQIWFINEEVLLIQAEHANTNGSLAAFHVGDELIAAFSFEQILGFCSVDNILESEDEEE